MIRAASWLLFCWLVLLFVVGQNASLPAWFVWLDALGAIFAALGGIVARSVTERTRVAGGMALGLGLLGLSLAGLLVRPREGLAWSMFSGAICYVVAVLGASTSPEKRSITRYLAQHSR